MTIGERIRQRRKELDISVDQLAEILGKNRATIYRYESDEIENLPTSILIPLANALQTTPGSLMGWEDSNQQIGERIKSERIKKGYSIEQLADKAKLDKNYIEQIENGLINIIDAQEIYSIAVVLNKQLFYLMGWEKEKTFQEWQEEENELYKRVSLNYITQYLGEDVRNIVESYISLNSIGKKEAAKRIKELTYIPNYSDKIKSINLNAAHADGVPTEEEINQTNEIMDDDKNWD